MNKETFIFDKNNSNQWFSIAKNLNYRLHGTWLKNFSQSFWLAITPGIQPKTRPQTRGFYRLCGLIVPFLRQDTGEYWDKDLVKELVKKRVNYVKVYKGIQITRSLKEATKEDMIMLIEEVQKFGAELGCENCYLESYEQQELVKYYQIN